MMYDHEKSDSAIVAVKPTNKAGQPAAELVEPSAWICFQYRSDAIRVQDALRLRLGKFGLTLESTKTKFVEFGRFAQRHAGKRSRKRPETIYFLGLTLYCTRNQKGNFKVGMRTEKSRLRRSLTSLQELMRQI